jgi:hypothetical protein
MLFTGYVHKSKVQLLTSYSVQNNLVDQRFQGIVFTRSNKLKIGTNCLSNRMMYVSSKLNFNWLMQTKTTFKMKCKKLMINDVLEL